MASQDPIKPEAGAASKATGLCPPILASGPGGTVAPPPHRPGSSFYKKLPADIAFKMSSFLDTRSLAQLSKTEDNFHIGFRQDLAEKKKVSEELIRHVFQANPKAAAEFFNQKGALKRMILTKTCYREGYFSQTQKKFIGRHWGLVSPLQAAALSGDNFLVRDLLSILLRPDPSLSSDEQTKELNELREEALRQLQEVINRKASQPVVLHASVVAGAGASAAAPEPVAAVGAASGAVAGHEGGVDPNRKRDADKKGTADAENTNVEYADSAEYLAPFKDLIKAYKEYLTEYDKSSNKDWDKLDDLWEKVGECQKRLPRYGLQEFFDNKPFDPIPDFNQAPNRGDIKMDLDSIGLGTKLALYKGRACGREVSLLCQRPIGWLLGPLRMSDLAAINRLCELLPARLRNIIEALQTPEGALVLIETRSVVERPSMS